MASRCLHGSGRPTRTPATARSCGVQAILIHMLPVEVERPHLPVRRLLPPFFQATVLTPLRAMNSRTPVLSCLPYRLAAVPVLHHADLATARGTAYESSLTTHPGPIAAEACAFLAHAIGTRPPRCCLRSPPPSTDLVLVLVPECHAAHAVGTAIHSPAAAPDPVAFLDAIVADYLVLLGPAGVAHPLRRCFSSLCSLSLVCVLAALCSMGCLMRMPALPPARSLLVPGLPIAECLLRRGQRRRAGTRARRRSGGYWSRPSRCAWPILGALSTAWWSDCSQCQSQFEASRGLVAASASYWCTVINSDGVTVFIGGIHVLRRSALCRRAGQSGSGTGRTRPPESRPH